MKKTISLLLTLALTSALASCNIAPEAPKDDTYTSDLTTESVNLPETGDENKLHTKLTPDAASPLTDAAVEAEKYTSLADFCSDFISTAAALEGENKNLLSSPLSAYFALSMVKEGAHGGTLDEMNAVMGELSGNDMYTLISHLATLDGTVLNIANSVWVDSEFTVDSGYLDTLAQSYLAECYSAVLKYAENTVNNWIDAKTNGLIKNMLSDNALDGAVMALVNAVYMKAQWMDKFSMEATNEMEFHNSDGTVSITDFMHSGPENELIIDTDDFVGIVLPYSDGNLSFVALMPKSETVTMSEDVAEAGGFKALADLAVTERTRLSMPVFEQSSSVALNDVLISMGIVEAFSDGADFTGIADGIMIGSVLQNTVLKVDEDGTEAAAATAVVMATSAAPPKTEPRILTFDRPFAFAVIDSASGAVLFAGEHNITG